MTKNSGESSKPKLQNRSIRNQDFETQASSIFKGKKLIVKRPEDMEYEDFKFLRKLQNNLLKTIFKKGGRR